ncbi:histidine phosphatase family protein [Limosilactobacillus caccae]|jgi:probable phosphoglycerate mutase|uniref:histidine phosphatase family protein n=1 Tax=Limosilactobacillus caccae TaxID=1926284 RepID=UPI00097048D0|nr:histidine phosphatase family protein [Limosilactobacillus caccae]
MAITVYFVRHGQTYLNLYNRMQGWSDAPLTPKGEEDAKHAGKALAPVHFDYVLSSDLARTMKTARLLLDNHPGNNPEITPEPAFREEFFGYFEGANGQQFADFLGGAEGYHSFAEMVAGFGPDELKDRIAAADNYHTAEDSKAFWTRIDKGFDHLRSLPDGSTVLVVSHGATIRSIANRYSDQIDPGDSPRNGSIMKMTLDSDQTVVDFYNKLELPQ